VAAVPHGARKAGQFLHRFAFHSQRGQESGGQHGSRFPRQQRAHGGFSLLFSERTAFDDGME
jgi:hypothetical protein